MKYNGNTKTTKITTDKNGEIVSKQKKTTIDWSGFPKSTQEQVGFTEPNIIDEWLDKNGNPEIAKQVEEEAKELCEQQTAVEWLASRVIVFSTQEVLKTNIEKLLEEAKKIEKQQIIDANIAGMEFIAVDINYYNQDAEQYYNETFKNKQ